MASIKTYCTSAFCYFRTISLKIFSFIFISALLLVLGLISLPLVLDQPLIQKKLAAGLSDWSGGTLSFNGAIELSYFPYLSLKAEHVFLKDIRRLPNIDKMRARAVTAKFQWMPLLLGRLDVGELELEKPEIYISDFHLDRQNEREQVSKYLKRIFKTVKNIPFTNINCKEAILVVPNIVKNDRILYPFSANLVKNDDRGNISGAGYVMIDKKKIHLTGLTQVTENSLKKGVIPLDIEVASEFFHSHFQGDFTVLRQKSFQGQADIKDFQLRPFLAWRKRNDFQGISHKHILNASGSFHWKKGQISMENAVFNLDDRNKAVGNIIYSVASLKPLLSGNLSFHSLDLSGDKAQDLLAALSQKRTQKKAGSGNIVKTAAQTWQPVKSALDGADADLRLSIQAAKIGKIYAQDLVATLLIQSGKVMVQLADAKVFDGRVYGALEMKNNGGQPFYQLDLSFKQTQARELAKLFTKKPLLEGRSDIALYLTSHGLDGDNLAENMDGKIQVLSAEKGQVGLDIASLFQRSKTTSRLQPSLISSKATIGQWQQLRSKKTQFEKLVANIKIMSGRLSCESVNIYQNGYLLNISGQTDFKNNTFKWLFDRKSMNHAVTQVQQYGIKATRRVIALVEGKIGNPQIFQSYVGINADPVKLEIVH